jgi:Concanavalin A-like lectin/glucanases superfamily
MKKQILFTSMTISVLVLVSCSKNNMELPAANSSAAQESNSASGAAENSFFINPLLIKLDGWYRFNGNLQDALGKLSPGVPIGLAPKYTSDRKGALNSALKLDGSFFVKLFNVPQQTASSISVWVKTFDLNQNLGIVSGISQGMGLVQNPNTWIGGLTLAAQGGWSISSVLSKDAFDLHWHHLAVTYDGSSFKFYVDGALAGSSNLAGTISSALTNYIVGNGYWKGAVDDLHFYSRTLTASDVTALYNQ